MSEEKIYKKNRWSDVHGSNYENPSSCNECGYKADCQSCFKFCPYDAEDLNEYDGDED